MMGLTFVDFVKHGVERKQGLGCEGGDCVGLRRVKGAVEAGEIVEIGGRVDAVEVVGRGAGPDEGGVVDAEGLEGSEES